MLQFKLTVLKIKMPSASRKSGPGAFKEIYLPQQWRRSQSQRSRRQQGQGSAQTKRKPSSKYAKSGLRGMLWRLSANLALREFFGVLGIVLGRDELNGNVFMLGNSQHGSGTSVCFGAVDLNGHLCSRVGWMLRKALHSSCAAKVKLVAKSCFVS